MGYYTELIVGCLLKDNTPDAIISTLKWMIDPNHDELSRPDNLPNGDRISWMLNSGGSYYFGATSGEKSLIYDDIAKSYRFNCRFNIKNYSNEIDNFLEWLKPYVEQGSGGREMWAIKTDEDGEPVMYYLN